MSIKVFIISSHLMFGRGLESLLQQESGLKIVGLETDISHAIEKIKEIHPDVVIIYADDAQIGSDRVITDIFKVSPQTRVISMSVHNNLFYVYQAARRSANSLEDLVKAIQSTATLPNSKFPESSWANQDWSNPNFS